MSTSQSPRRVAKFPPPLALSVLALSVLAPSVLALAFAQPAFADDTLSVSLGARTPALMNSLNLVAEGAGFYKDEHLTITRIASKGALDSAQSCSSGLADICPIGIEPVVTNYADGIRLKMFLTRASKFAYVIAVPEDSPIRSLADFRGKNIGVHVINGGASGAFTTTSTLSLAGLKPGDYTLVPIGYEDQAADAIASGKVAGAAFPYYEFIPLMVSGRKLRIFQHPTLKDVPNTGYAVSPAVLEGKKDAVMRFSRAIVKAALFIRYDAQAAARILLAADGKPYTDEDLRRKTAELTTWQPELPAANPRNKRIGAFDLKGTQAYIQLLADSGVIKEPVPATAVVTDEFIAFANKFDHRAVEKLAKSMH